MEKEIVEEKITPNDNFERVYNIGHFLQNYSHPLFDHIKPVVFGRYRVVMKFTLTNYGIGGSIWCNGRWLCMRRNKFSQIKLNRGVLLIAGTPTASGGSNSHPLPSFKEGYCVLEFLSNGLPMTESISGWTAELMSLELLIPQTKQHETGKG